MNIYSNEYLSLLIHLCHPPSLFMQFFSYKFRKDVFFKLITTKTICGVINFSVIFKVDKGDTLYKKIVSFRFIVSFFEK